MILNYFLTGQWALDGLHNPPAYSSKLHREIQSRIQPQRQIWHIVGIVFKRTHYHPKTGKYQNWHIVQTLWLQLGLKETSYYI